jgi:2-haloacid dehalogenase
VLDFSQFRVLTFDCYGTLIDWETGIFGALRPILAAHGKAISDADLLRHYSELEADAEQGRFRNYRQVLESVVCGFGQRLGFKPTQAEAHSLADSVVNWGPFPDTVAALQRLKRRYNLAVISNIDDDLFAASAAKLADPFDFVITAQQARCYKPGLAIFNLAMERIGLPANSILHVGQSIYHDVIAAQSLGLATVWINRPSPRPDAGAAKAATGKPDMEFKNLTSLADTALQSWNDNREAAKE